MESLLRGKLKTEAKEWRCTILIDKAETSGSRKFVRGGEGSSQVPFHSKVSNNFPDYGKVLLSVTSYLSFNLLKF